MKYLLIIPFILLIFSNLCTGQDSIGKWSLSAYGSYSGFFSEDDDNASFYNKQACYHQFKAGKKIKQRWEIGLKNSLSYRITKEFNQNTNPETKTREIWETRPSLFARFFWDLQKSRVFLETDNVLGYQFHKSLASGTFLMGRVGVGYNYFFSEKVNLEFRVDTNIFYWNWNLLRVDPGYNFWVGVNYWLP